MLQIILNATAPIVNTLINTTSETLEILSKVNEFYDSSWNKLLYVLSGAFAVLAIAVPVVIQYIQNKIIKASEKELENKIVEEIEKAKKSIKDELTNTFELKTREYDVKLQKLNEELSGMVMDVNGINAMELKDYKYAFQSFTYSLGHYIDADVDYNTKLTLGNILECLDELNQKDIEFLRTKDFYNLESHLNKVVKNADDELIELIISIKEKVKKKTS